MGITSRTCAMSGSIGRTVRNCAKTHASRDGSSTGAPSILPSSKAPVPHGVKVLQPARIVDRRQSGGRWRLAIDIDGRWETLDADFLAEAGGRASSGRERVRTGPPTLAVYAYWRGARLPSIAAHRGRRGRLVLGRAATQRNLQFARLRRSEDVPGGARSACAAVARPARRIPLSSKTAAEPSKSDPPRAIDATPYLARDCVGANAIRLGDAALAIDPISSSGVQKAIQSALSGAIVANTLLRKPDAADLAMVFIAPN